MSKVNKTDKKESLKKEDCKLSSIGGQALYEGVMMMSKNAVAITVRDERGEVLEYTERQKSKKSFISKVFLLRGFFAFISSMVNGIKYITKSFEPVGDEEEEQLGVGAMAISIMLGLVFAVGLFSVLPRLINWLILDVVFNLGVLTEDSPYWYVLANSLLSGLLKICILVLYMFLVSKMKSIKRMFQYHGAEHKTINCYEHNKELTIENVQSFGTKHNRCGTTFMFYTVAISIFVSIIVAFVLAVCGVTVTSMVEYVGSDTWGTMLYNVILIGANLIMFPITSGLSYEFLKFMAKMPDNAFFMFFKMPGLLLQRLTTKEPDDDMVECAIRSFENAMAMDEDAEIPNRDFYEMTMSGARKYLTERYLSKDIEECEVDWTLCEVTAKGRGELHTVKELTNKQGRELRLICEKRVGGKPLDYITGKSEFYGLQLAVNESVLIPRLDTESVVEEAVKLIGDSECKVLDLMTGSGCIAMAISHATNASVTASDKSKDALKVAKQNCGNDIALIESDCFESITGVFDMIISNPPYIKAEVIEGLQDEVKCQPKMALDGGADGLDFYRIIAGQSPDYLTDSGRLVLEIGYDQGEQVVELLEEKFIDIKVIKDLCGNDRTITAVKK